MTFDPRTHPSVRDWLAGARKAMRCAGRQTPAASGRTIDVIDPATESVIASVPDADAVDVAAAVEAASAELTHGTWPRASSAERERVLLALAAAIEAHADELQHLIVLENGKLLSAARREVDGCVRFVRYTAGWATKITGETLDVGFAPAAAGVFAYTRREPVGVVAGIIPWNMPLAMAAWKSVPALMCGCTVVLKPAEEAPLSTLRLAELAYDAGLPPAALSVVTGHHGNWEIGSVLMRRSMPARIGRRAFARSRGDFSASTCPHEDHCSRACGPAGLRYDVRRLRAQH